jgi:hypothetical protein
MSSGDPPACVGGVGKELVLSSGSLLAIVSG